MNTDSTTITAVCHVRAPLLLEPIDRQVETLRACESEGTIDDLLLRSWPKEVEVTDDGPHHEVLETYDRFRSWADGQGADIHPPFTKRTTTARVTGETSERLVTPLLCLELYADDELVGVYPHSADDETITTDDAIATLRCGDLPTPLGGTATDRSPTASTRANTKTNACPDCDGALIDGQGLVACSDCEWTGIVDGGAYVATSERATGERTASSSVQTQRR